MVKSQLVKEVSKAAGLTHEGADKAVSAVLEIIQKTLAKGEEVSFKGFGSFSVNERPARSGRNPRTGEVVEIGAKKIVKFKSSSELKKMVNS